ncbi:hypothetical protein N7517_001673 [Penicillium concentricum]|uniref:Transcription factor domain-containing protein n=1 Tax=Penicillium concentricum TaxID=293559 RepID=A0A9W9SSE6_9EURO|nr:uncharacterized protein N7517_001673 [Penicillium concentricum]KAJ5383762.1 hypothetical protein N7517_001673 [Penicillium concentricum]
MAQGNEFTHSFTETSSAYGIMHRRIECQNLIEAFLLNCFPFHWPPASHSWIRLLGELPTKSQALEMSSAAVAASAIGHMFHDQALVKQGLNYYTQGLRELQKALWDPILMREDGTLAACMALSLYEALECPNLGSEGYFNHCRGLIALIQSRGHEVHSSGAGHRLFLGVRVPGILFSLKHHTSTMFFESTWMEQPWARIPKSSHDRVIDCLAQAPMILERVRSLPHLSIFQQVDLLHCLIGECWQIDKQLDVTYDEMRRSEADVLYWPVPSQTEPLVDSRDSENLFAVVFCFQNAQVAATLMLLWATRTMLWSGLFNMYQHLESVISLQKPSCVALEPLDQSSLSEVMGTFNPIDRCGEYLSVAHRVCQSVEYFLKDEMLLAGPLSVSPALGIVIDSLRNRPGHDREIAWIQAALEVVRRKGLRVLQDVNSI